MKFWMKFIKFLLKINRFFKSNRYFSRLLLRQILIAIFALSLLFALSRYFCVCDGALSASCSYPLCVLHACTACASGEIYPVCTDKICRDSRTPTTAKFLCPSKAIYKTGVNINFQIQLKF